MRRGETPILFVAELRRRRRRRRWKEEPIICVRQRVLLLSLRKRRVRWSCARKEVLEQSEVDKYRPHS